MKKMLHRILNVGLILTLGIVSSCSKDDTGDNPPPTPPDENQAVVTDVVTPIKYYEQSYTAGENGVSVKVSNAGYDNIRFICTPGSEVHSYLVQIYPLASLYNTLLNVLNETEAAKMTTEETDNYIANIIAQTEYTSGGVVVNDTVLGGQFAVYEFDASAVEGLAAGYLIQPDADYLIVVQAAFDETAVDSDSYGDLTVCHVKTPKRDLVGSPQVGIDITAYYNSYKMSLNAEGGCHYLYFLGAPKSEIDQYINAYGETMYRDFLRHYGSRVDVSETGLYEHTTSDTSVDITQEQSATAIALDINGSPAPSINRRNFPLKQKPDDRLPGDGKITEWGRIGATIMYFNLEMDENTKYVNYALVTPQQAETWKNSDETTRMTEAKRLRKEGWHIVNPNYKIDTDLQVPTGTAWSGYDYQNELDGDTEYAFVYSAENGFGDVTDLMISETFKTLPLVKDKPEECKAEVEFTAIKHGALSLAADRAGASHGPGETLSGERRCPVPRRVAVLFLRFPRHHG